MVLSSWQVPTFLRNHTSSQERVTFPVPAVAFLDFIVMQGDDGTYAVDAAESCIYTRGSKLRYYQ